eukprot:15353199-Ditylum_brightwellii.AAC.1
MLVGHGKSTYQVDLRAWGSMYVDDCQIFANSKEEADEVVRELKRNFDITDEGETIEQYLGVKIDHSLDGTFRMHQPHLLNRLISTIPGIDRANEHLTPASSTSILTKDQEGEPRKETWNYRSMIGMLNFLVNSTHPELACAVHQCARFCEDPKPDLNRGLEVYVDVSFAGDWNKSWSEEPSSVFSRTGFIVKYANCPIIWTSKLQIEITLSSTESEYVALSHVLREVLPLIGLIEETKTSIRVSKDDKT